MPRSQITHGKESSTELTDSFYYFEDPHGHSDHFTHPRVLPDYGDYGDYVDHSGYSYSGYAMADEDQHRIEGEQSLTNNEDWETHLRSCQVTGPQRVAAKGVTLNPGMVVTIQSRGPTKRVALFSHCSVRALRVHDSTEVSNSGRSVTGVQVAQTSTTVTMEYRFDDLVIEEAGDFYFDMCIYGMDTMTSMTPRILVMWGEKHSQAVTITD